MDCIPTTAARLRSSVVSTAREMGGWNHATGFSVASKEDWRVYWNGLAPRSSTISCSPCTSGLVEDSTGAE